MISIKSYYKKAIHICYANVVLRKAKKGRRVSAVRKLKVLNPQYFVIGDRCFFGPGCRIEAWDSYNGVKYEPKIELGEDVRINSSCHIGAINRIKIGDECLFGSHVMITDHAHGSNSFEELKMHPSKRNLYTKGDVVVGERCWICENAVILPNVHIGSGCIIGANAVVTTDIPDHSVAVGNPARVIKTITDIQE